MKKFLLCLALLSVISSTAVAKPFHHPLPPRTHKPAPIIVHDRHYHAATPFIALTSGLIGFVAGAATTASTPTTVYAATQQSNQQCFAVVSKSTGVVSQRCLSGDNQVLYVD